MYEKFEQEWLAPNINFIIPFLCTLCFKSRKTVHYIGKTKILFLTDLMEVFIGNRHSLFLVVWEK